MIPSAGFCTFIFPAVFFSVAISTVHHISRCTKSYFFWEKEKKKTTKGWKRSPPSGNWISIVDYFLWKRKELLKKNPKTFEGHKVDLWQMNFSNSKFNYYLYQNLSIECNFFQMRGKSNQRLKKWNYKDQSNNNTNFLKSSFQRQL